MTESVNKPLNDEAAVDAADAGESAADAGESAADAEESAVDENEAPAAVAEVNPKSVYAQLGGAAAVEAAVDIFYRKILSDQSLSKFFEGVDLDKQAAKQRAFQTMAFGGPNYYTGKDLTSAHAKLVERGMNNSHVSAVLDHLQKTLQELEVPGYLVVEVMKIAETTRDPVLGR